MSEEDPVGEPIGDDARIDALDKRLIAARGREDERTRTKVQGGDAGFRLGHRVLAELLGGLLGGAVIGGLFDAFARTSPWGLLVMLFAGIGVAFRNIIRISGQRP